MSERPLEGKVAVVTGASRGIGKQTCLALTRLGASLVLASRTYEPRKATPGTLEETAAEVRALGGDPTIVVADLAEQDGLDRVVSETLARHDHVDLLINNAAYTVGKALWTHVPTITRDQWEKGFAINLTAPLMLIQGFWESMKAQGGGRIVNVSSGAANLQDLAERVTLPNSDLGENGPLYGATKAALNRMANSIAGDGAAHNIAVINMNPGLVLTEIMAQTFASSGVTPPAESNPPTMPAAAIAHLCTCDDVMRYSGKVLDAKDIVRDNNLAY